MATTLTSPELQETQNKTSARKGLRSQWVMLVLPLVVAAGAWLTWTAYSQTEQRAFDDDYETVRDQVRSNAISVEGSVARISEAMVGVAEAIRAQPDMPAPAFAGMVDALVKRYPAVSTVAIARAVTDAGQGGPITEKNWLGEFVPAEKRTFYLPVQMIRSVPVSASDTATASANTPTYMGFDINSDEQIRNAVEQASKTGSAISYASLQKGLTLLVTRVGDAGGSPARYVLSEINIAQLLGLGVRQVNSDVQVFDISQASGAKLLFTSLADPKAASEQDRFSELTQQRRLAQSVPVSVLGRSWSVYLQPLPGMLALRGQSAGRNIALLGAVATLLSALFLYTLLSRSARIEREVQEKTVELEGAYQKIREKEMISMQTEKMSALGQMIAGVAHEINTPLGFVTSNVQTMEEDFDRFISRLETDTQLLVELRQWQSYDQPRRNAWYRRAIAQADALESAAKRGQRVKNTELTGETTEGLSRISELVSSLKDFSRVDRVPIDDVDIHHCITRTLNIARNQIKHKATVVTNFGDLPHVRCNPSQINQVLLNLITNAAQAIPDYGVITISTFKDNNMLRIEVEDDGAGMSDDVKAKIFEPFFTTKDVGKGTGLGLAISDKIIKDHGGRIWVDTQVGLGTKFNFTLPLQGAQSQSTQEE